MNWTEVSPGIRISEEGKYASFYCIACKSGHGAIPIGSSHAPGVHWQWDGNSKTLTPSVRHFHHEGGYDEQGQPKGPMITTCHYNVTNGKFFYHNDCTDHKLQGDVDMVPFPATWG